MVDSGRALDTVRSAFVGPFRIAASVRHARVFHPKGLVISGTVEFNSSWWPGRTRISLPVTARMSGGIGTPSMIPDVLGLALRIDLDEGPTPWDLLLASSGTSSLTRMLPLPSTGWNTARYSSLMPLSSTGGPPTWVLAEPVGEHPPTTSINALADALAIAPLVFSLQLATFTNSPTPSGRVVLSDVRDLTDDEQPSFDPVVNCPPSIALRPEWLAAARIGAYRGSRRGRGATDE
jgi:hypothetical protein